MMFCVRQRMFAGMRALKFRRLSLPPRFAEFRRAEARKRTRHAYRGGNDKRLNFK